MGDGRGGRGGYGVHAADITNTTSGENRVRAYRCISSP
jgi:hypothetical protein